MKPTKRVRSSSVHGPTHDEKRQKRSLGASEVTTLEGITSSADTLPLLEDLPASRAAAILDDVERGRSKWRATPETQALRQQESASDSRWDEGESISSDSGYDSDSDATSFSELSFVPSKFAACNILFVRISDVDHEDDDGDDEAEQDEDTGIDSANDLPPKTTSVLQPRVRVTRSVFEWLNQLSPSSSYHPTWNDDHQTQSSNTTDDEHDGTPTSLSLVAQAHHAEGDVYANRSGMTASDEEFFSEEEPPASNSAEAAMDYWYD
ncbi:uncharacterized protein BDZ99DRAFT_457612 [Mytilinidion resinicola]|uniref:Uncharacterized protein n=1 Tax=Mytilinidion resinicola TaxID=574789 RepID=A0A6A6Z5R1_9PEZI|nr:uncharacterized protein BDZ99DRAFT_457612 [Mytilinidion resinicola]KAF2815634.1 hypothetical protein BDZ99DRAFT_457612 [Mytilinidion resinicola]